MKRWNHKACDNVENAKVDTFIEEVIKLSKKHKLSISHEDGHGAFQIEKYSDENASWLRHAADNTDA